MRPLVLGAVVERIANFPFRLRFAGWACAPQKTFCHGQNGCDITWGYVAWQGRGWGMGSVTSFFSRRGRGQCLENFQQVCRNG